MNWHYITFSSMNDALRIAHREAAYFNMHFSIVIDCCGVYSVWPGILHETEAVYITTKGAKW